MQLWTTSSIFLYQITLVTSLRILLVPFDHKPHVNLFALTGQYLQKNGHDVLVVAKERHKSMLEKSNVPFILNPTKKSNTPFTNYTRVSEYMFSTGWDKQKKTYTFYDECAKACEIDCQELMQNEAIMTRLFSMNFDIAIVDGTDFGRCLLILPYKLGIKFLTIHVRHDPWKIKIPAMPSIEGNHLFVILPEQSSFIDRLKNLGLYIAFEMVMPMNRLDNKMIADLAPEKPAITFYELYQKSEVYLVNGNNYCSDIPRVTAPHSHFIGGVASQPAKPLSQELSEICKEANEGIIVVSFGSFVKRPPFDMMEKMFEVFAKLPQIVLMRYDGQLKNVPDNVKLFKWLPQNDLLGQPNARLFITHGGLNSLNEALFHGVPMLSMPFGADQEYNAARVVYNKFGKSVNPLTITSSEMLRLVIEVLSNPVYVENVKRCSAISKSFPSSHEQIEFWIKHVVEFGSDHLKPRNLEMPLWQFFMLDVLFFLLIVLMCSLFVLFKCFKLGAKVCHRRLVKTKTE